MVVAGPFGVVVVVVVVGAALLGWAPRWEARGESFGESMLRPPERLSDRVTTRPSATVHHFDGSPTGRVHLDGAHALDEFTLALELRSREGCVEAGWHRSLGLFVDYDPKGPWYLAGCSLVNAVVSATPPAAWRPEWRTRRGCCAVPVEDELVAVAGTKGWRRDRRTHVRESLFRGARSDFGLTLSPAGDAVLFGVGHRDFAYRTRSGRPVRDVTLATAPSFNLIDDRWHSVVAVRRRRRARFFSPTDGGFDDASDLEVYVDGARLEASHRATGGANASAAARAARASARHAAHLKEVVYEGDEAPVHVLDDAAHWAALGQLYRGCLRNATLSRRAWSTREIRDLDAARRLNSPDEPCEAAAQPGTTTTTTTATTTTPEARHVLPASMIFGDTTVLLGNDGDDSSLTPRGRRSRGRPQDGDQRRFAVYFLAHSDPGSRAMRDAFVETLRGDPGVELHEVDSGAMADRQSQRYGPKGELIRLALAEQAEGSYVVVTDIDVRFFKPVSAILRLYASAGADAVFQRDDDFSLTANLGFMALRCTAKVRAFFDDVSRMAVQYAQGQQTTDRRGRPAKLAGGDQRLVNQLLRHPDLLFDDTAEEEEEEALTWALFPTEVMTKSIDQQRGMMYKHEVTQVMYHLNDFGSQSINPAKARAIKVAMLDTVQHRFNKAMTAAHGNGTAARQRRR